MKLRDNRKSKYKRKPYSNCAYCGQPGQSIDHVMSRSLRNQLNDVLDHKEMAELTKYLKPPVVDACLECNSVAGSRYFSTIAEKREFIQSKLRKKYASLLKAPAWSETELSELGDGLATSIRANQASREVLQSRLAWRGV